jgi:hypothetical protein
MKARPSYLRSFSDRGGTAPLPLLHAPAAPVWPLRNAAADAFAEGVAPQSTTPRPALPVVPLDSMVQPKETTPMVSETIAPARTSDPTQPPSSTETPHRPRETHAIATPPTPSPRQPVAERTESRTDSAPRRETTNPVTTPSVDPSPHTAITPQSSVTKSAPPPPSPSTPSTVNSVETRDRNDPTPSASKRGLDPLLILERASLRSLGGQPAPPRDSEKAESRNTVHIGKIDIHIAPPPAPAVPRRVMRQMPANPGAALASGFLSSFGLRQG